MDPVGGSIPVFHPIFQHQGIPSVPEPFPPSSTSQMRFFSHEKSWKTLCPKAQVSPIPAGNKSQIPTPPPFPPRRIQGKSSGILEELGFGAEFRRDLGSRKNGSCHFGDAENQSSNESMEFIPVFMENIQAEGICRERIP